jgi:hypothetical protein
MLRAREGGAFEAEKRSGSMPHLVKFLALHAVIGFAIGLAAVVLIVYEDIGRIGTLIETSSQRWLALGLLSFVFGLTFASVQMGFAIMLMPSDD